MNLWLSVILFLLLESVLLGLKYHVYECCVDDRENNNELKLLQTEFYY
jgi:hypothetical protein